MNALTIIAPVVVVGLLVLLLAFRHRNKPNRRLAKILPLVALLSVAPASAGDRPVDHNRYDCASCHRPHRYTLPPDDPSVIEFRKWLESRIPKPLPARPPVTLPRPLPSRVPEMPVIIVSPEASPRAITNKLEREQWENVETLLDSPVK